MRPNKLLQFTVVAALTVPGAAALAADGTVTINGTVSAVSCTVRVAGGGSSATVTLPTVSRTALSTIGATAGATPFIIAVSGCTGSPTSMNTYFEPGSGSVNANGRLSNTGTATGVEVQIATPAGNPINLNAANGSQGTTATPISGGAATQNYIARYYATASTGTSGTFSGSFAYSIVYQ